MTDIIHLLPDSVANQIAAGEVIQRPSSVVKELVENAIDANATHIQLWIQDAGRTLIQVIDNGSGMSTTDARLAFERHATSKIRSADDLFRLTTMGFRGEALASIAAVAHVELRTRRHSDDVGTAIRIAGSRVEAQEVIQAPVGTNFAVRNLFFNIPARRKFLKSNQTEFGNILQEFERITLVNPTIEFELYHNQELILTLPSGNIKQRVASLFKKNVHQSLLNVELDTSIVTINGFVGTTDTVKRRGALQFFFINGRYMRHPYFHKAVMQCYENIIPSGESPNYFLYLTTDPSTIDVNIHPTKTEIKFENEQAIWQFISAAVREALGKNQIGSSIDFDVDDMPSIPPFIPSSGNNNSTQHTVPSPGKTTAPIQHWEKLYDGFINDTNLPHDPKSAPDSTPIFEKEQPIERTSAHTPLLQVWKKYILFPSTDELLFIDQHRAHLLIQYHSFLRQIEGRQRITQQLLFPEIININPSEQPLFEEMLDDLNFVGFDLAYLGANSYSINGLPPALQEIDPAVIIQNLIDRTIDYGIDAKEELQRHIALTLAHSTSIASGQKLSLEEMQHLIDQLFQIPDNRFTPEGKRIISSYAQLEINKRF